MQPKDLPPWLRVHQLMQRWFKAVGHDLRTLLRLVDGRSPHPSGLEISERSGGLFKVLFPQPLGVRCAASAAGCWPTRWARFS